MSNDLEGGVLKPIVIRTRRRRAAYEPIPRELDVETLARIEKARRKWEKILSPLYEGNRRSGILTARDYMITITSPPLEYK